MTFQPKRLFLVACVAVTSLLIAGCSGSSDSASNKKDTSSTSTTAADVSDTTEAPTSDELGEPRPGYDEWEQWKSDQSSPAFDGLMQELGLAEGSFPNAAMVEEGYIGVAQLGTDCIVAFLPSQSGKDLLSVAILSRFSPDGLAKYLPDADLDAIKQFIDKYRATCTPGVSV